MNLIYDSHFYKLRVDKELFWAYFYTEGLVLLEDLLFIFNIAMYLSNDLSTLSNKYRIKIA